MAKYLNPKSDRTFKKVFGEHKELPSMLTAFYGYPQCLMNDKYVVKFLHEHGDTMSIESISYSIDKYWDQVSRERTALNAAERKGREEGRKEGEAIGMAKGEAIGLEKRNLQIAQQMKADGMPIDVIVKYSNLSVEQIERL